MLHKPRVANVFFPSTNRFLDVQRALEVAGAEGILFPWNTKDYEALRACDGYVIAGGFSYQDMNRSGSIAAGNPIVQVIRDETERTYKPWLGICNGFQIQVESGALPGVNGYKLGMGLAPNAGRRNGEIELTGFDSDWVFMRVSAPRERNCMTYLLDEGNIIGSPIAHAEGRVAVRKRTLAKMISDRQVALRFCDKDGAVDENYPINPNGSVYSITGVSNPKGNVAGLMPHPESACFVFQLPESIFPEKLSAHGDHAKMRAPGPGRKIFDSFCAYMRDA